MRDDPIFIFGTGRCGSTYLQRLVSLNSPVWVWGEHGGAFGQLFTFPRRLGTHQAVRENILERRKTVGWDDPGAIMAEGTAELAWLNRFEPSDVEREIAAAIDRIFRTDLPEGWTRWGFKEILYGYGNAVPEALLALFPASRAIFSFREPRSTIHSMLRTWTPHLVRADVKADVLTAKTGERIDRWLRLMGYFLDLKALNGERVIMAEIGEVRQHPAALLSAAALGMPGIVAERGNTAINRGPPERMTSKRAAAIIEAALAQRMNELEEIYAAALALSRNDLMVAT